MTGLSEKFLNENYTIYVSKQKREGGLQGTCHKKLKDGLRIYKLPQEELIVFSHLPNIISQLEVGELMQVTQSGSVIHGVIGSIKTEGPYCETEYLEVHAQQSEFGFYTMLVSLEAQLAAEKESTTAKTTAVQYKKLYKGADRYE